jgi:hypothetical protein
VQETCTGRGISEAQARQSQIAADDAALYGISGRAQRAERMVEAVVSTIGVAGMQSAETVEPVEPIGVKAA